MLKKYGLAFGLLILIVLGFAYAIFTEPELPEHRLFSQAIQTFAKNAASIESEFISKQAISTLEKQFNLNYTNAERQETSISLKMVSINNLVTLTFGQGESLLAEQTIVLEPYFNDEAKKELRWKCIGGSVLIRLRTKSCRLGYGIESKQLIE